MLFQLRFRSNDFLVFVVAFCCCRACVYFPLTPTHTLFLFHFFIHCLKWHFSVYCGLNTMPIWSRKLRQISARKLSTFSNFIRRQQIFVWFLCVCMFCWRNAENQWNWKWNHENKKEEDVEFRRAKWKIKNERLVADWKMNREKAMPLDIKCTYFIWYFFFYRYTQITGFRQWRWNFMFTIQNKIIFSFCLNYILLVWFWFKRNSKLQQPRNTEKYFFFFILSFFS